MPRPPRAWTSYGPGGSLARSPGTNVAYLVADPPWFKALGSMLTAGISVAVLVRTLRVFPFDFGDPDSTWDPILPGS
jgi:hypothetical protein